MRLWVHFATIGALCALSRSTPKGAAALAVWPVMNRLPEKEKTAFFSDIRRNMRLSPVGA